MFGKCDSSNIEQLNGETFHQVLTQNLSWFLS